MTISQGINRRHFSIAASSALWLNAPVVWAQTRRPITLGQSVPLSGPNAELGIQYQAGAQLYFDEINAQGGVKQRQIKLHTLDDGYEPDQCVANTRKFINEEVFALFGYLGTPTSLAALPLATAAKIPFFAPLTGSMALRVPLERQVFHIRASYEDETALIVKHLVGIKMNDIAVFYQNDSYGQAGLSGIVKALEKHQKKPIATAVVERNSVNVEAAVQEIMRAHPAAIVQICTYKAAAAFIRAARKAGYAGVFYNVSFVGTNALVKELGNEGAGTVVSQVMPSPYSAAHPLAREFKKAIQQNGNKVDANFLSIEGYLAARVFIQGLLNSENIDSRDAFITALEAYGNQRIAGFSLSFSPTKHTASHYVTTSMIGTNGAVRTYDSAPPPE